MEIWIIEAQGLAASWNSANPFLDELKRMFARARTDCIWSVNKEDQFRAAVGAVMLKAGDEDKAWLKSQVDGLKKFSAFLQASQAGLSVDAESLTKGLDTETPRRSYTLMGLWNETEPMN